MRPIAVPLILVATLVGTAAAAQSTDPYNGYGTAAPPSGYDRQGYPPPGYDQGYADQGQAPGYGNPPPPPGGVRYRDDERYGSTDSFDSADARADDDPQSGWPGRGGPPPGTGRQSPRTRAYAGRVAQWRARADACEAGDLRACRGPD